MNKIAQCWSVWVWKSVHLGLRRNGMIHVTYFWESREIEHSAKRQAFTLSHWRIFCYFCLFVFETGSYYPKLSLDLSSNIYPQPVYLSLLSWWDCRCAPPHLARISICRTEINWGIGTRNKLNTGTLQPRVGAFLNLGSLSVWKFVTVCMILQAFSGSRSPGSADFSVKRVGGLWGYLVCFHGTCRSGATSSLTPSSQTWRDVEESRNIRLRA